MVIGEIEASSDKKPSPQYPTITAILVKRESA